METKKRGDDMNAVALRAGQDIKDMAAILATFPEPSKWTPEQKTQAVNFAALLDTAQKMITVKNMAGIDYEAEKETFLGNAGKTDSKHTHRGYRAALDRLDAWAARQAVNVLEMTPAQADDFIYSLRSAGASTALIRLTAAACSSFFTFLERRHAAIKNIFRGTKARPAEKPVKVLAIPTTAEVKTILAALPPYEAAAVSIMALRGLRAGALPEMTVTGDRFKSHSKGKDISGELPKACIKAIGKINETGKAPFSGINENTLEKRIARLIDKLCKAGKVEAAYSCHDLRHFYAVTEYRRDKDIKKVQKLLGHASIAITDRYLRGLGELE